MNQLIVINVVGLSSSLITDHEPPFLKEHFSKNNYSKIKPAFPAVTCSAQTNYLTGRLPQEHGVVGNGWYYRDLSQVWFWRQSNHLVQLESIWDIAKRRNSNFTCANLFWWYNMYSSVDYSVTPRPIYRADGLKLPDLYSNPPELRDELQNRLGPFPLFKFWGPGAGIESSRWISEASKIVYQKYKPTLNLIYLPHLDYVLQKEGPLGTGVKKAVIEIDEICKDLYKTYRSQGCSVIFLSEYGIGQVNGAIQINRILRKMGLLAFRIERGEEHLDAGASKAFAVVDHQIAHLYLNDKSIENEVKAELKSTKGIKLVLDSQSKKQFGIDHDRSGDLVVVSEASRWFSYYWWLEDEFAPDYARTVDIHRKPGYDPVELFLESPQFVSKLKIAKTLLKKKLGMRYLMNVISLDDSLVKGSHGSVPDDQSLWPVICSSKKLNDVVDSTDIRDIILSALSP